ncbi:hypothetical protein J6590_006858 [Homalodisca vitripennis]|nr:hypothetical protein J6590_006858 [Homalodisca vitripennis]
MSISVAGSGEVACSELSPSSKSSSSSVTADSPTLPSIKWPSRQLQRRSHTRHSRSQSSHPNTQACWTVTLAGSSGHPSQPPPDVEMRLSFSNTTRGQATSQSDSGLGEDGPSDRGKKQQALPPPLAQSNQWKVMLKTQQETDRSSDPPKGDKRTCLPDFSYTPSTARSKKSTKPVFVIQKVKRTRTDHFLRGGQEDSSRPLSVKVQEILEHNISLHKSSVTEGEWVEGLSVTGLAITPERKPRVPTMSERDLTRQWFHRSRLSQ